MTDHKARIAALPKQQQLRLLSALKRSKATTPAAACIHRPTPRPEAQLRLFCFAYAGGSASLFTPWAEMLPDVDVCAFQLPGREERKSAPPHRRMEPLVDELSMGIEPYLDKPFAFFGHSLGSIVAFELARRLRRERGQSPTRLCVAAHRAPQLPNPHVSIYHLPEDRLKSVLRREGVPAAILDNAGLMKTWLPLLRADLETHDTYQYTSDAPLDCALSIFGGQEDARVDPDHLRAWSAQCTGASTFRLLTGGHFFIHESPPLLAALRDDLKAAASPSSPERNA